MTKFKLSFSPAIFYYVAVSRNTQGFTCINTGMPFLPNSVATIYMQSPFALRLHEKDSVVYDYGAGADELSALSKLKRFLDSIYGVNSLVSPVKDKYSKLVPIL